MNSQIQPKDWRQQSAHSIKTNKLTTFVKKPPKILLQFLQYIAVGGLAFIVDYSALYFTLQLGFHYLIATAIGFTLGLALNFLLCITWIWRGTQANNVKDFTVFTIIGIAGLGLTALLMWTLVDIFYFAPTYAKVITAAIVLIWNFSLRKLFVFFH